MAKTSCSTFKEDLTFGEAYQQKFVDLHENDSYEIKQGYFKAYDVIMSYNKQTTKYEVKADRYARFMKSIAVEFEYKNEPSGINSTEADYWVHFVHDAGKYFIIPVSKLRKIIKQNTFQIKKGGDGFQSKIVIVPFSFIEKYSHTYSLFDFIDDE